MQHIFISATVFFACANHPPFIIFFLNHFQFVEKNTLVAFYLTIENPPPSASIKPPHPMSINILPKFRLCFRLCPHAKSMNMLSLNYGSTVPPKKIYILSETLLSVQIYHSINNMYPYKWAKFRRAAYAPHFCCPTGQDAEFLLRSAQAPYKRPVASADNVDSHCSSAHFSKQ